MSENIYSINMNQDWLQSLVFYDEQGVATIDDKFAQRLKGNNGVGDVNVYIDYDEKMAADKMAADKMAADKMAADKMAADKMAANRATPERDADTTTIVFDRTSKGVDGKSFVIRTDSLTISFNDDGSIEFSAPRKPQHGDFYLARLMPCWVNQALKIVNITLATFAVVLFFWY